MKRLSEIRARQTELKESLAALGEQDELSEEDEARFASELEEWDALAEEAQPLEERAAKLKLVRNAAVETGNTEPGANTRRAPVPGSEERNPFDLTDLRTQHMLGGDTRALNRELISRARQAIEDATGLEDAHRETATRHAESNPEIAAHILRTGSPEYREAFAEYVSNPLSARAALSLTSANGGYLVPFTLDPTIILTNNGATNPFREIATIKTTTTNTWNGVSSAGVTAEWLAEATEAADASPTFAQPSITVHKAAAYVQASLEVTQDSGIGDEIGMLIADAKDRLEATAFATGSGSGQPYGIVTALGLTTASRVAGSSGAAGAADFVVADVYALVNALPPRHRPNGTWLAEMTTINAIRRFATGSGPQHAFWADLGAATPPLLLGRPVRESSAMDSTVVSGSNDDVLIFGDFRDYYIVDRIGLSIAYDPLVKGSNRRPTGEVGWFAYWRVGGDSVNDNAFRMLRL